MARIEDPMLRYSSLWITLSVTQLAYLDNDICDTLSDVWTILVWICVWTILSGQKRVSLSKVLCANKPDSHWENCLGIAVQLTDVCCIHYLVHPGYHEVNANNNYNCDGDDDADFNDDDDEDETCQRRAPTLKQKQSQRACSPQRRPEL